MDVKTVVIFFACLFGLIVSIAFTHHIVCEYLYEGDCKTSFDGAPSVPVRVGG